MVRGSQAALRSPVTTLRGLSACAYRGSKHIHVRYQFVRQQVEGGIITMLKVSTKLQLADVMTKALSADMHWMRVKRAAGMSGRVLFVSRINRLYIRYD
jgi:hypothetical protein